MKDASVWALYLWHCFTLSFMACLHKHISGEFPIFGLRGKARFTRQHPLMQLLHAEVAGLRPQIGSSALPLTSISLQLWSLLTRE